MNAKFDIDCCCASTKCTAAVAPNQPPFTFIMEDHSRCFPVPPLPAAPDPSRYASVVDELSSLSWAHYERGEHHYHSLYVGLLGPCAYVRYRLAQSLSWSEDEAKKGRLLRDAARTCDLVLDSHPLGRRSRVTLLEGERVGALALSVAIHHALRSAPQAGKVYDGETSKEERAKRELLDIGSRCVRSLGHEECEVLYGRAGYLQAIAFVRSETTDYWFGKAQAQHIVKHIVKEGERVAAHSGTHKTLLWEWHGKAYLGAIHGVAGIIFTLLLFYEEVSLVEQALEKIKATIAKLDKVCFASGNLKSSLGTDRDKLVHLCHGAPGHILLLVKAYEVLRDRKYLERAEQIATNVICRRGLLRKGVGLCHGISGNAYCFLALHRGRKIFEHSSDETSELKSDEWLRWAHHFAAFAIDHPDVPAPHFTCIAPELGDGPPHLVLPQYVKHGVRASVRVIVNSFLAAALELELGMKRRDLYFAIELQILHRGLLDESDQGHVPLEVVGEIVRRDHYRRPRLGFVRARDHLVHDGPGHLVVVVAPDDGHFQLPLPHRSLGEGAKVVAYDNSLDPFSSSRAYSIVRGRLLGRIVVFLFAFSARARAFVAVVVVRVCIIASNVGLEKLLPEAVGTSATCADQVKMRRRRERRRSSPESAATGRSAHDAR
ncbi:hypothetical protein ACHAWF_019055 [Thalassiosira exigua]